MGSKTGIYCGPPTDTRQNKNNVGARRFSQYLFSLQKREILWNTICTVIHSGFYIVRKYTPRRLEHDLLVSAGWGIFENSTQIFAGAGVFFFNTPTAQRIPRPLDMGAAKQKHVCANVCINVFCVAQCKSRGRRGVVRRGGCDVG